MTAGSEASGILSENHTRGIPRTMDLGALHRWLDQHTPAPGESVDLVPVGGGTQNLMFAFRRGARDYVLRCPPEHRRPSSNRVLRSEVRFLRALGDTNVPVPRVVAECDDESVMDGAFFYAMERVDGINATVELSHAQEQDASLRHRMGLAAVEVLVSLGEVDHHAVGLSDVGSPDGFLERQVGRWIRELDSFGSLSGYPGPNLPGLDRIAAWLESNRPATSTPGVMHGDYHLANLMYARDSARISAVVDWEMATIGDPLLDLGWLLATWPDDHDRSMAGSLGSAGGLPARAELISHYQQRRGCDVSSMPWYSALACFKLGIVLEGTFARSCAGRAPRDLGLEMRRLATVLFVRAQEFMTTDP